MCQTSTLLQSVPRQTVSKDVSSVNRDEHTFVILWIKRNWYGSMMKRNTTLEW